MHTGLRDCKDWMNGRRCRLLIQCNSCCLGLLVPALGQPHPSLRDNEPCMISWFCLLMPPVSQRKWISNWISSVYWWHSVFQLQSLPKNWIMQLYTGLLIPLVLGNQWKWVSDWISNIQSGHSIIRLQDLPEILITKSCKKDNWNKIGYRIIMNSKSQDASNDRISKSVFIP